MVRPVGSGVVETSKNDYYSLSLTTEAVRVYARTSSPTKPVTLATLKPGDRAVITAIDSGEPMAAAKLAARGIVPGIEIGILRAGDPCLIGIDQERWALNQIEACSIHVDVLESKRRTLRQLFGRS